MFCQAHHIGGLFHGSQPCMLLALTAMSPRLQGAIYDKEKTMKGYPLQALLYGLGGAALITATSSLAEPRQEVLEHAEEQESAFLETLEALVNIDSGTGYVEGLAEVEEILHERLTELGASVDIHPAEALGGNTLVGTLEGSGDRDLMLMIHYDTVFDEGTVAEWSFHTDNGRAYGPGVGDAKGGVAVILHSLAALEALDFDGYGTISVVFNPDEEQGSLGSRDLIQEIAAEQDVVLVFEPTLGEDGVSSVTTVTKGINYAFLEVQGRSSHAGSAPEEGRNAVMELSHQLLQLADLDDPETGTTLNWTVIEGGGTRNIIPEAARAEGDMRYFEADEYERIVTDVEAIIEERLIDDTEVTFTLERGRPPLPDNPQTQALAEQAQRIYQELGLELQAVEIGGGTDAAYAYQPDAETPAVLESLGLVGGRYHSSDEFVELDSIVPRLYLATRLIMELSEAEQP